MQPLDQFSVLHVEGADAGDFLHSQLSNNIIDLGDGASLLAAYCEPAGRVLAVVLVYRSQSSYYLVLDQSLAIGIAKRLQIYVLRSKVTITSLTGSHYLYGMRTDEPEAADTWPYPLDAKRRFCLQSSNDVPDLPGALSTDQWRLADIQAGAVWLDSETTGKFLPQALNLVTLGAVDFNKGCYPGQEIVARSHYLGSVKRRLIRTIISESTDILPGLELFDETEDGVQQLAGKIAAVATHGEETHVLAVVKTSACSDKLFYYINGTKRQTDRILSTDELS
jgi:folate-binding protein YgfZ